MVLTCEKTYPVGLVAGRRVRLDSDTSVEGESSVVNGYRYLDGPTRRFLKSPLVGNPFLNIIKHV